MPARRLLIWSPRPERDTAWKTYQDAFGSLASNNPIETKIYRHRDEFFRALKSQQVDPAFLGVAVCMDDLAEEGNKDDAQELDSYHVQGFAVLLLVAHELDQPAETWGAAERGVRLMLRVAGERWR